ncbi:GNAT family N-acetyltransferase [Balamuthia mandrillaris]
MQQEEGRLPVSYEVSGWSPPPVPSGATLTGRYCRLEKLDAQTHGPALFEANALDTSGAGWTYLSYGPFETLQEYMGWLEAQARSSDPLFYVIVDTSKQGSKPVGLLSYLRITPSAGSIEIGHRTTLATEAFQLMMRHAFDDLGYRRLEWKCDALNTPSRAAAQRLGLSFEGIFRQHIVYKGRNRDTAWYAAIDKEWPMISEALETWLQPSNFDEGGAQRQRLSELTRPLLKNIC